MTSRLGILATHPIQYYSPWFKHLANHLDLTVFYAHRQSPLDQANAGFGVEFEWDTPLLDDYEYRWLTNVSNRKHSRSFSRFDTPELSGVIEAGRFDAFLIFGWNYKSAWQAYRACRRYSVPALMRGDSQLRSRRGLLKIAVKKLLYPMFLPRFAGHLYVGSRNKEYLLHYGVPTDRLHFVPHFVDVHGFHQRALTAERDGECRSVRKRLCVPENAFVFSFFGKLIPKKRPEDFILGLHRYFRRHDHRNVHALIVGDGPMRTQLEQLASPFGDRIHFTGFVNQSRIAAYYRSSGAIVLPSDGDETWGLVVNEAAACGVPAIVSEEAGCAPDLIDDERTGFQFSMGDVEMLVDRMESMRNLCAEQSCQVRSALDRVSKIYSISEASERLFGVLDGLASRISHAPGIG